MNQPKKTTKPPVQVSAHWLVQLVDQLRRRASVSHRALSRMVGMSGGWWVQISGYGKLRGLLPLEKALRAFGWELVARRVDADGVELSDGRLEVTPPPGHYEEVER